MPRRAPASRTASTNRAPWAWGLAGALVGLLLGTLFNAPAHWLTRALQQASSGRVVFQDVRGTLWQGSARLVLSGGPGSTDAATLPGRLNWLIRPSRSGLLAELQAACCMQQPWRLTLRPRWAGAQLSLADSQSQWPAAWLTGLGTPWNTVQPEGQLTLTTQGLAGQWAAGRLLLSGRAQVDASRIASRLSTLKPMGSYRITVQGGATPSMQLETLEGRLQLSGTGQWVGSHLRFQGEASATPEHLDALSNLLNIIGRRDGARAIIKVG